MNRIYLDYAASTPVDSKVLASMTPYFTEKFGNPSSIHNFGQQAQSAVDTARQHIADFLHCKSQEIVFSGSATEANNFAIQGVIKHVFASGKEKVHIIASSIEHESVLTLLKDLIKDERINVTLLPVNKEGVIDFSSLQKSLTEDTVIVSVMYVNNETGVMQPIQEIANCIKDFKKNKKDNSIYPYFHTDAVQAALFCPMDVSVLGVDMLTLSGHKIYAPKGIGMLYVKKGTMIEPLIHGSGQEYGKRSGTENVPGIVGMGCATTLINDISSGEIIQLKKRLIKKIIDTIPNSSLNGNRENTVPHIANILFKGTASPDLIIRLDGEGIAVSAGAACQSKAISSSHVLEAMGLSKKDASSSLRFSLGKYTTEKDIDNTISAILKLLHNK